MIFKDKIIAVTGASRGIGRNIADCFEKEGAIVIRCARKAKEFNVDLAEPDAPQKLIDEIYDKHSRLDVLVNNARASERQAFFHETADEWEREISVSLRSTYFLSKYAIERMHGGAIVNIGSITSHFVSHESAAYQISKGAVLQLTRCLAKAGGPRNVRVNAVLPGLIIQDEHRERYDSANNAEYRDTVNKIHPLGRPGDPEDIAQAVMFLSQAPWITGTSLIVDGGLTIQQLADYALKASS